MCDPSPVAGAGDCILEWDGKDGEKSPVPLLKDMFGSERRKAKVTHCLAAALK
jgi:hypothetical protein